ncbi:CPBP family intramembrane metalloprotease [soil metagenome]
MRVQPKVWIGIAIWIGYAAVVFGVQITSGIPFPEWGMSAGNLFRAAGVSLLVAAVLLIITTSVLGWWRPVIFDREKSKHRWPIIAPIAMAVLAVVNLSGVDWGAYSGAFFAASLSLAVVGFTEEIVNRGLLLVALRSRFKEGMVWFLSTLLFAVTHFLNIGLGQDFLPTLQQVAFAFGGGTIFYIFRRTTGSLIPAMILHGLWDFSFFAVGVGTPATFVGLVGSGYLVVIVFGLISVAWVIRGANEKTGLTR